ncbi:MAG: hypothetical protein ACK4QW_08400 [Alphaproteobacteria bacterium]
MDRRNVDLPATIFVGLVIVPLVAQIVGRLTDPWHGAYKTIFETEMGFIELATAALLFACTILLAQEARRLFRRGERANGWLAAILSFGTFFVMGEEISWGQWFFHWDSPEWFLEHNDQGETNLHNLVFVKKDIPKWFVVIGIAVFGVAMPLMATARSGRFGPIDRKMLPTAVCIPVGIVVVVSHLMVKLLWWFGGIELARTIGINVREATEFYIALFGLIYTLSLRVRLAALDRVPVTMAPFARDGEESPRATGKSV